MDDPGYGASERLAAASFHGKGAPTRSMMPIRWAWPP